MGFFDSLTGADKAKEAAAALEAGHRAAGTIYDETSGQIENLYQGTPGLYRTAVNSLAGMYGPDGQLNWDAIRSSPDYKFMFDEGMRAVNASGAARGMNASGAQLKALTRFGQGTADMGADKVLNRMYSLMNAGGSGENNIAGAKQWGASGRAGAATGAADARASGLMAQAGINNSLFNTALNLGMAGAGGAMGGGGWAGAGKGILGLYR